MRVLSSKIRITRQASIPFIIPGIITSLNTRRHRDLSQAFKATPVRFCVISFTGDWLFPTSENQKIVHALNKVAANVSFAEIESDKGHDAFLLEEPDFQRVVKGFLDGAAAHFINANGGK